MNRFFSVFVVCSALLTPRAQAQADKEIVTVNGTPIRQSEVFERLWKTYGPATMEEMVDELLLRQAVEKSKIKITPAEVDRRFNKVKEQFSDAKILEAELANAGSSVDKLKGELREQLSREKLLAMEKGLSVSDADVKKAFDEHKDELGKREAIHLRHILVAKQEEADKIVADVKGGADFKKLAAERSLAPTGKINGGDYGYVAKGMLPPEIESVAFGMKANELKVLPSQKGFHVLQALDRRTAAPAQYAKIKDDLREILLQEKVKAALPGYLKDLRSKATIKPAS